MTQSFLGEYSLHQIDYIIPVGSIIFMFSYHQLKSSEKICSENPELYLPRVCIEELNFTFYSTTYIFHQAKNG